MSRGKSKQPNNPYASASGAYDQHAQDHATDPRELEARVLLKSVRQMQALQNRWDSVKPEELDEALRYNRHIWMMFVDTAVENGNPGHTMELRNNIANLGTFVCKHSLNIIAAPAKDKLNVLIEINREIAAGLMTKPPQAQEPTPSPAPEKPARISAET
jgi:flagellar protein FlaF